MNKAPQELAIAELEKREVQAVRALNAGEATAHQQRLALAVIVRKLSRAHDLPYVPGASDATAFLNGRAFVGKQLLKLLSVPVDQISTEEPSHVET